MVAGGKERTARKTKKDARLERKKERKIKERTKKACSGPNAMQMSGKK